STLAPANNGLDADYKNADGGVGDISVSGRDLGAFKSPSLRNVEHTAPYMHDGRFDTLEKVIDHYSKEVKPHPNLDPRMRPLNFTDSEKAALVAFLKTLTDHNFLKDPKFSDPFQERVPSNRQGARHAKHQTVADRRLDGGACVGRSERDAAPPGKERPRAGVSRTGSPRCG